MRGGGYSIIDRPVVDREFTLLGIGSTLEVTVVGPGSAKDDQPNRYLARARATGVLLTVRADTKQKIGSDLQVEVSQIVDGRGVHVIAVPTGTRKAHLDLPTTVTSALRAINTGSASDLDRELQPFAEYAGAYREGIPAAITSTMDASRLIVAAAATALDHTTHPGLPAALARWLHSDGIRVFQQDRSYDLAPLVAACYVAAVVGDTVPAAARFAVFATHQLGRRAVRSLQVEPLARHWLGTTERRQDTGPWLRLRKLELRADLSPASLQSVLTFCDTVVAKPVLHGEEDERAPVADHCMISHVSHA